MNQCVTGPGATGGGSLACAMIKRFAYQAKVFPACECFFCAILIK